MPFILLRPLNAVPPKKEAGQLIPGKIRKLNEIRAGHWVKIMALHMAEPARSALDRQGLHENRKAKVLHNDFKGRVLLNLDGDLYLLGRLETPHIQVREYVEEKD